jgi:hypothetical protein
VHRKTQRRPEYREGRIASCGTGVCHISPDVYGLYGWQYYCRWAWLRGHRVHRVGSR